MVEDVYDRTLTTSSCILSVGPVVSIQTSLDSHHII